MLSQFQPKRLPQFYIAAMMTSHLEKHFSYDVELGDYQSAQLPKPTLVRLSKIVTLESDLIEKKLGRLQSSDQDKIKKQFHKLFAKVIT